MTSVEASHPIDKISVYVAAGLISGCGALMFNVMPVFVGAAAKSLGYGEAQLGDMVAFFNIGFTLSALSAPLWVRSFDWRCLSIFGVALSALGLAFMGLAEGFVRLSLLVGLTGIAMGGLYALVLAILGDSENPDRSFGLKLGLETLPGAILLFLLPVYVAPKFGFTGVVYAMAIVIVVLGAASFLLPKAGIKNKSQNAISASAARGTLLPLMGLFSSLLFFTGIAATWAFLELVASAKNLSPDAVGVILSVAFVICGLGGFAAAAIGDKYGRRIPVIGIIVINLAGLWWLAAFTSNGGYAAGACLFLFSVNFTLAYTFGITAQVDAQGKLVVLSAASLSIGAIVGPAIAGRLVEAAGYNYMLGFSALCSVGALGLYALLDRLQRKTSPASYAPSLPFKGLQR